MYFRKTWGETVVGQVSIGLVFLILIFLGAVPVVLALMSGNILLFLAILGIFLVYVMVLLVVSSALQGIFSTALYLYASTGKVPEAFTPEPGGERVRPERGTREYLTCFFGQDQALVQCR